MLHERAGRDSFSSGPAAPFTIGYGGLIEEFEDTAPSPEELLIALEEGGEEAVERRRLPCPRARLHEMLTKLPPQEREALVGYYGGQTQTQIAVRTGVSQNEVFRRIGRAIQRLKWMAGPGSWFTSADVERDLAGTLPPEQVHALAIYWRTTSYGAVQAELGSESYARVWQMIQCAIAALSGRYRRGFDLLSTTGKRVFWTPAPKLTGIEHFLQNRCAFVEDGRAARETVLAVYERHVRALGRAAAPGALNAAILARGARRSKLHVSWAPHPVHAYAGLRLQPLTANGAA